MRDKDTYKSIQKRYNVRTQREIPSESFFKNQIWKQNEDESNIWFNTDEAALFLRILVHRAKVKYFKLGRRLRFRQCDLLNVLQPMEV